MYSFASVTKIDLYKTVLTNHCDVVVFYIDISKNLKPSKIIIIIEKNIILRAKVKYWCYTLQSQFSHLHRGGQSLNGAVNLFTKKKKGQIFQWQTDRQMWPI